MSTYRYTAFGNLYEQVQTLTAGNSLTVLFNSANDGGTAQLQGILAGGEPNETLNGSLFIWDPAAPASTTPGVKGADVLVDLHSSIELDEYTAIHYHNRSDRAGSIAGARVILTLPQGSGSTAVPESEFVIEPGEMVTLFRVMDNTSPTAVPRFVNVPGYITPVNTATSTSPVDHYTTAP